MHKILSLLLFSTTLFSIPLLGSVNYQIPTDHPAVTCSAKVMNTKESKLFLHCENITSPDYQVTEINGWTNGGGWSHDSGFIATSHSTHATQKTALQNKIEDLYKKYAPVTITVTNNSNRTIDALEEDVFPTLMDSLIPVDNLIKTYQEKLSSTESELSRNAVHEILTILLFLGTCGSIGGMTMTNDRELSGSLFGIGLSLAICSLVSYLSEFSTSKKEQYQKETSVIPELLQKLLKKDDIRPGRTKKFHFLIDLARAPRTIFSREGVTLQAQERMS
jgi:hypothetical protein